HHILSSGIRRDHDWDAARHRLQDHPRKPLDEGRQNEHIALGEDVRDVGRIGPWNLGDAGYASPWMAFTPCLTRQEKLAVRNGRSAKPIDHVRETLALSEHSKEEHSEAIVLLSLHAREPVERDAELVHDQPLSLNPCLDERALAEVGQNHDLV